MPSCPVWESNFFAKRIYTQYFHPTTRLNLQPVTGLLHFQLCGNNLLYAFCPCNIERYQFIVSHSHREIELGRKNRMVNNYKDYPKQVQKSGVCLPAGSVRALTDAHLPIRETARCWFLSSSRWKFLILPVRPNLSTGGELLYWRYETA